MTRKVGEVLIIGDDIRLTVLAVRGRQVRIGIDAPKDVAVHREEIYRRIHPDAEEPESKSGDSGKPESKSADSSKPESKSDV